MEFQKKLRRLEPLVRAKRIELENASQELEAINQLRRSIEQRLAEIQASYLEGCQRINEERLALQSRILIQLERSVDFAREQWGVTMRQLQVIKGKEAAQRHLVQVCMQNLKAVEMMQDRYRAGFMDHLKQQEQRAQDERTIYRNHLKRSARSSS